MRKVVFSFIAAVLTTGAAFAQSETDEPPAACRQDGAGAVNFQACADAAPQGSMWRALAQINLATQALRRQDYAEAVRLYDLARPAGGQRMYSDAGFHAYRADAYWHVGRRDDSLWDARTALAIMTNDPSLPEAVRAHAAFAVADAEGVYALILPMLHTSNDPAFAAALARYNSLPAADWISHQRRAGVLEQLGDYDGALAANAQARALAPDHPAVLNNECYILVRAGRADEGLPFCRRAITAAPDIAAVRHSYASALATTGDCAGAERELAEARRLDPVSQTYGEAIACTRR